MLRGDEADLFRTYEVALRAAVRSAVFGDDAIIDDACSFAWLQLLRRQPNRDSVFGWLYTVAVREAWRLHERDARERPLECVPPDREPHRDEVVLETEAHAALAALASLPQRQRDYLTLLVTGLSYDEIARHHGVTYTTVNRHLARARHHLRLVRDEA
jgi:RNA polymerase sigma factor (sigma-70 family)